LISQLDHLRRSIFYVFPDLPLHNPFILSAVAQLSCVWSPSSLLHLFVVLTWCTTQLWAVSTSWPTDQVLHVCLQLDHFYTDVFIGRIVVCHGESCLGHPEPFHHNDSWRFPDVLYSPSPVTLGVSPTQRRRCLFITVSTVHEYLVVFGSTLLHSWLQ